MKILILASSLCLLGMNLAAQFIFNASTVPSQAGEFNASYYSTNNTGMAAMLAISTNPPPPPAPALPASGPDTNQVPQLWTFSQAPATNEISLRTDIIAPADGADGDSFPAATYAEQDSLPGSGAFAWRYYSLTNTGRQYYGFYEPPGADADSLVVFDQPTTDLPATIALGQTWTRNVTWTGNILEVITIDYQFTANATVDAYGTLVLRGVGDLSALRVHETHVYQAQEEIMGSDPVPIDLHTNQYYYWVVAGLGVAVQVFEFGDNVLYPQGLAETNAVERMYQASYYPPPVVSTPRSMPNGIQIKIAGSAAQIYWNPFTNCTSYQVQEASSMAPTNWQTLGLTTNVYWLETLQSTPRFYRVIGLP